MARTAQLARVAVEAADAIRTGQDVWIVVSWEHKDNLQIVGDEEAARLFQLGQGEGWEVFGPFNTPPDGVQGQATITKIEVTRVTASGEEEVKSYDPNRHDSLFFDLSAVDKFVVPYYARVDGPEAAAALRQRLLTGDRLFPFCHVRSRDCDGEDPAIPVL